MTWRCERWARCRACGSAAGLDDCGWRCGRMPWLPAPRRCVTRRGISCVWPRERSRSWVTAAKGCSTGCRPCCNSWMGRRAGALPAVTIRDWPRYALRIVHWDTKHHQDRPETLKRLPRLAGAVQGQRGVLRDRGQVRVPVAPGHRRARRVHDGGNAGAGATTAWSGTSSSSPTSRRRRTWRYVLKHPEFAHLRCDGSNYQACVDDPEVRTADLRHVQRLLRGHAGRGVLPRLHRRGLLRRDHARSIASPTTPRTAAWRGWSSSTRRTRI